jgi:hypothetical protein
VSHGSNSAGIYPFVAVAFSPKLRAHPFRIVKYEEFMSAELNIYNPEELGPPMGQYTHVTRVKANEFLISMRRRAKCFAMSKRR